MTEVLPIAAGVFIGELVLSAVAFGVNTLRARAIQKAKAANLAQFTEFLNMQHDEAEAER